MSAPTWIKALSVVAFLLIVGPLVWLGIKLWLIPKIGIKFNEYARARHKLFNDRAR